MQRRVELTTDISINTRYLGCNKEIKERLEKFCQASTDRGNGPVYDFQSRYWYICIKNLS